MTVKPGPMAPHSVPGYWEGLTMRTHHPITLLTRAVLLPGLLSVGIAVATTAQAGNQLFEGSWTVKAQGNECSDAVDPTPGPHCGGGESESDIYGAFGIPQQIQCNANQPRCPFDSTPTNGAGVFAPLGGGLYSQYCAPWANWQGNGTSVRPEKGGTDVSTGMGGVKLPPFYRNPAFFTAGGQPGTTRCDSNSRSSLGGKGLAQAGVPITGTWGATTTTGGAFNFAAAPANGGVRVTGGVGEFPGFYPYRYSYTYVNLKNQTGVFGPGNGPGDFSLARKNDGIYMKQGAAKFGGTMTMLGAYTTKVCYYRNGGCSIGSMNWRYEAIGQPALTSNGVVTQGYIVTYVGHYYHTALNQTSTINVYGSRFPWATGSLTVTATGRGPHNTVHYTMGSDNRTATSGKGTIQLVTPVITRWLQPAVNFETGGVGILRIKFVPEPQTWAMLFAGVSLLGVGYRMRGR
jgi:hypothetical protein